MTTGLSNRKPFNHVIDYIQNDKTKIKYPDRTAKFVRNSFEFSQLDNAGIMLMEQQHMRELKEREKDHLLRQLVKIQTNRQLKNEQVSNQKPQYMLHHKHPHQGMHTKHQLNRQLQFKN